MPDSSLYPQSIMRDSFQNLDPKPCDTLLLGRMQRSIARIVDAEPDPVNPELVRATLSVVCPNVPGMLAGVTGWLWHEVDANIISGFGGCMEGDIHGSFFTIRTSQERLGTILHEVNMHRVDDIKMGGMRGQEDSKVFELTITAPDRSGIFYEVTDVLTKEDRNVNILSQSIVTKEYPESPLCPFTHIRLRIEVPVGTVPMLPRLIDEIRDLSRGEEWLVVNREPESGESAGRPLMMLPQAN